MTTRIKLRRDTAANWLSNDPILALGEAGYDTTNNELRVGDGVSVWSELSAVGGSISSAVAIAPELGPAVIFARPENTATDAVNAIDLIDTGVALGRDSNQGGLLNTLEDDLNGWNNNNYNGQPTFTEWNTDGWADLSNVTTRAYQNFKDMKQDLPNNDLIGVEIIMHDTLNDKYYTFKFNRWSVNDNGGDGGFGYTRRLINVNQYFTKPNGIQTYDEIDTDLVITRGNNGGIYNDAVEGSWDRDVSPLNTRWNIDGWSDLSNLLTRTYTNFASAFSYQIGERVVGKEAIMHDTTNDKYYAVKFLEWGQNNNGSFTWQRRLIDTTQINEGLHFPDGTVQTTAGVEINARGNLELPGGLDLPTTSMTGYDWNYNITGSTLKLGSEQQSEVIITGPTPGLTNPSAQRITIQGQRAFGRWANNTSTVGEGGDVYIWGGVGGEADSSSGGTGGDVKVRGGTGQDNEGGYVRIEGGDAVHWGGSYNGDGGFVEITGGDVAQGGGNLNNRGGDVRITGGRAYSASTQSGSVQILTGSTWNSGGDQNTWTFDNDGSLSIPGTIKTTGTFVVNNVKLDFGGGFMFYNTSTNEITHNPYVPLGMMQGPMQTLNNVTTGTNTFDCEYGHIFYVTNPQDNWTANFINANNFFPDQVIAMSIIIEQGATAYLPTAVQVEGNATTLTWLNNTPPTGHANRTDVVSYRIICTATNSYKVLATLQGY